MSQKKSESRRHAAAIRVDASILDRVKLAASLMRVSLADYASGVLAREAEHDIAREAGKLASPGGSRPDGIRVNTKSGSGATRPGRDAG